MGKKNPCIFSEALSPPRFRKIACDRHPCVHVPLTDGMREHGVFKGLRGASLIELKHLLFGSNLRAHVEDPSALTDTTLCVAPTTEGIISGAGAFWAKIGLDWKGGDFLEGIYYFGWVETSPIPALFRRSSI